MLIILLALSYQFTCFATHLATYITIFKDEKYEVSEQSVDCQNNPSRKRLILGNLLVHYIMQLYADVTICRRTPAASSSLWWVMLSNARYNQSSYVTLLIWLHLTTGLNIVYNEYTASSGFLQLLYLKVTLSML